MSSSDRLESRRDDAMRVVALVLVAFWGSPASGQTPGRFVARLSTVPITVAMQNAVSGQGTAEAVLTGTTLEIDGKFKGLRSPATFARLHLAAWAMRGPAIGDLSVSRGTSGTISGAVELTPQQRQALEESAIYLQIHSEKAPEGNLWGWLIPQEATR